MDTKIIVRFKGSTSKYEEITINASYNYKDAIKVLRIMNRKLSQIYKYNYISIIYKVNNTDSFLYVNCLYYMRNL